MAEDSRVRIESWQREHGGIDLGILKRGTAPSSSSSGVPF